MPDTINLDDYAEGAVQDGIYGMQTLDIDTVRENTREAAGPAAENACTYTNHCRDIISRYEGEQDACDAADLCLDGRYTALQWQDAMVAYARAVALCVVQARSDRLVDKIEQARGKLFDAATMHGAPRENYDEEPAIGRECPHGWAVHDKEDADGVYYWTERHLEGCRAVAVKAAGVWLSYTWTPADTKAEATSGAVS